MSDSSSSGSDGEETWIHWFCGLDGHEVFCEVDRSYIEDGFNLFGLRHWVPNINDCLDVILDRVRECPLLLCSRILWRVWADFGVAKSSLPSFRNKPVPFRLQEA